MLGSNFGQGLIYAGLVVILGLLYFYQQRMVVARALDQPDDVRITTETHAIPAGGLRSVSDLFPSRVGDLLHHSVDYPHLCAVLHHATVLR